MPQEPKRRHSKARKRTRRASIKLQAFNLVQCKNCHSLTLPHQVCKECGFYAGVKVNAKTAVTVIKS